ncbi:hypothetical protein Pelo_11449 [Pelomyxa schiedti]|nr:hypothetical protein Pelo_11449 [Pelomyxa schiedti]
MDSCFRAFARSEEDESITLTDSQSVSIALTATDEILDWLPQLRIVWQRRACLHFGKYPLLLLQPRREFFSPQKELPPLRVPKRGEKSVATNLWLSRLTISTKQTSALIQQVWLQQCWGDALVDSDSNLTRSSLQTLD